MPTVECNDKTAGQSAILEFFGLREQPFGVTPDPRFLYLNSSHREALATLVYGIESKRGFSALIAKPGMGKTTLLFYLLEKLKATARTAFLFRPDSNTKELLESLLLDLGLEANPHDVPQMHETLKSALLDELRAGKHFVWVIDEAQDLDSEVLESVRLLSNFETPGSKLMHILLAGQPELAEKLARPELLQLRQRISTTAQLSPLSARETSNYIRFRIRRSGGNEALFAPDSMALIGRASLGIPRNINHLCFSCLSLGFVEGQKTIRAGIVREVLAEQETAEDTVKAPPVSGRPAEFVNSSVLPDLVYPVRRQKSFWNGFAVIGFFLVPFVLAAMETSSRFSFLEAIRGPLVGDLFARVTGLDPRIPDLPDVPPRALQPPKPPMPLPDSEPRPPAEQSLEAQTTSDALVQNSREAPAHTKTIPRYKTPRSAATRVVIARPGDSLFDIARKYYGRSNGGIVARIQSHNPQIKSPYVRLRNQPVALPDLAPEFPWKDISVQARH
jgi:type II secretory pathway predicted ATPase ExeA/phage tail protein X